MREGSFSKTSFLPRILWVNKNSNMRDLHLQVFAHLRWLIAEWIDWKDPKTKKSKRSEKEANLPKDLPQFPYKQPINKQEFLSMSLEDSFALCFSDISKQNQQIDSFDIKKMPYNLCFKDVSSYYEQCFFCDKQKCDDCSVPFVSNVSVSDMLKNLKITHNDTFFADDMRAIGKELQLVVVWHQLFPSEFFNFLSNAVTPKKLDVTDSEEEGPVRLTDCLKAFKQQETLDEDNMWYCNKCQEHVQATKTLELFKLPRIMIISLKRFKQSKSRYGSLGIGG